MTIAVTATTLHAGSRRRHEEAAERAWMAAIAVDRTAASAEDDGAAPTDAATHRERAEGPLVARQWNEVLH